MSEAAVEQVGECLGQHTGQGEGDWSGLLNTDRSKRRWSSKRKDSLATLNKK